jgi:hypothetical protein
MEKLASVSVKSMERVTDKKRGALALHNYMVIIFPFPLSRFGKKKKKKKTYMVIM